MQPPRLAYVEPCLPGATPEVRAALARELGLALELADQPGAPPSAAAGVEVVALQAYGMHELHPLHPDPRTRERAEAYVAGVLDRAGALGIPRVVCACGFGHDLASRPFARSVAFFGALGARARALGVRILIEPLSPLRAAALTDPAEIAALLAELSQPDVFGLLLDTGHLLDGGYDPARVLAELAQPVVELQLRGPRGGPPLALPLGSWLGARGAALEVVSIEHRGRLGRPAVESLVEEVQSLLTPG